MDDDRADSRVRSEPTRWTPSEAESLRETARVRRQAADASKAEAARRRLRVEGIVPIQPEDPIGDLLGDEERIIAMRHRAMLDRRQPGLSEASGLDGDLYVTTRRVIHVGREPVAYDLDCIEDAVVIDERLIMVTREGLGISLIVDDPRSLRVEIAAARADARSDTSRQGGRQRDSAVQEVDDDGLTD